MSALVPLFLTDTIAEEARSIVGSLIAHIINTVRTLIAYAMEVVRRFMQWAGEHPLASVLMIANVVIWVS